MKLQTQYGPRAFLTSLMLLTMVTPAAALEVVAATDVEIRSSSATCPSGLAGSTSMRVGFDDAAVDVTHRALMHFDLDAGGVPASAELIDARLVFYAAGQTGSNFDIDIHRITEPAAAEYGTAYTRANGMFDLVVNGGGELTVTFEKEGYIPVHRKAEVLWRDFATVEDVVMIPYDDEVTQIDLNDPNAPALWVHAGSVVPGDEAGQDRQARVMIAQGTTAQKVLPDGSLAAVSAFGLRATEFTFGAEGPEQMPAPLPPTSGYTYAVELSAHDATTDEAFHGIQFSQPVIFYVDNFLGFPTGTGVPVGYYDRDRGVWVPSQNGEIIEIVALDPNDAAIVDTDTDPNNPPDNGAALGMTYAERLKLGELYSAGKTLWRVTMTHLTPWDCNWPWWCKNPNCEPPPTPYPTPNPTPDPCEEEGSIIECPSQTLGELVEIFGTGYRLHYRSDRVTGRSAERTFTVLATEASVPAGLARATIEFEIAGRRFVQQLDNGADQRVTFKWDGRDAFGLTPLQSQLLKVKLTYWYEATYYDPADFARAFALLPSGVGAVADRARQEIGLTRKAQLTVPPVVGRPLLDRFQSFGDWSLDIEQYYDLRRRVMIGGDGGRSEPESLGPLINDVALDTAGAPPGPGTPTPTPEPSLGRVEDIAFLPDGSFYVVDRGRQTIRYVDANGVLSTVAGGTVSWDDGAPARDAFTPAPGGMAVDAQGRAYYTHRYILNQAVRRIEYEDCPTTSPCVFTVAGKPGFGGYDGDDKPATDALLNSPADIEFGPDGGLYIADQENHRVRKVQPDGTIVTVAGNGEQGYNADGIPATDARLNQPRGLAFGPDGSLYIAEFAGQRIRRVAPDGIITTIAGTGQAGYNDGILAVTAKINSPYHLVVGRDGSVYFAEEGTSMIRLIRPDGVIERLVGRVQNNSPLHGSFGLGGPAFAAGLRNPMVITRGPDGDLYIAEGFVIDPPRIRRIGAYVPPVREDGAGGLEKVVASEDGTELHVFNEVGFHVRTLDALTGKTRRRLTYEQGRLRFVEEVDGNGDGNQTEIERSTAGCATAIIAPGGQRTDFEIDPATCRILGITNPAGETQSFTYKSDGLMETMTDARDHQWTFTYDDLGRLTRDDDAGGGYKLLGREETEYGHEVTTTTALGRATAYRTEDVPPDPGAATLKEGGMRQVTTQPSGLQTVTETDRLSTTKITSPDGTKVEIKRGPDPRLGMSAPVVTSRKITTPANLTSTVTTTRAVTLADPADLLSLTSQIDTVSVNGKQFQTIYTAADPNNPATVRTIGPSPNFRETLATLDDHGRVVKTEVPGLAPISWVYDAEGRLERIQHGDGDPNDPNDPTRQTRFAYYPDQTPDTPEDRLLWKTIDALGRETLFEYDDAGRVNKQTLPDDREILYSYDANGNLESLTPPGRPAHAFNYSPVNLESEYIPPQPSPPIPEPRTQFVYNEDRQLEEIVRPDGQTVDFEYGESDGRLMSVAVGSDVREYTYYGDAESSPGQLKTLTGPDADLTFTYDGALLKNETWTIGAASHTVARTYNNNLQVSSLKVDSEPAVGFSYDNDGLLRSAGDLALFRDGANGQLTGTAIDNIEDTYEYNELGEVEHYHVTSYADPNDPNGVILFATDYERDKLGRITQKSETIEGVTTVYDYTYDDAGRLWIVKEGPDELSLQETARYTYDDNGNRLTKVTPSESCTYAYDDQDRLLGSTCGSTTTTFSYTANGDLMSKDVAGDLTAYIYDAFGALQNVTLHMNDPNERVEIEYLTDGHNRRIGKQVDGVILERLIYGGELNRLAEFDVAGNLIAQFVYGQHPTAPSYVVKHGALAGIYRLVTDHLGSLRLVVDVATGVVVERLNFDEFGKMLSNPSQVFKGFGFAGGIFDSETGLVRFGSRDYSPEYGRWLAKDPAGIVQSPNAYSYVVGDPVNLVDPEGEIGIPAILVALGGFCSGFSAGRIAWDWRDPFEIQDSLALIDELIEKINDRLDKCDAATAAQLLESRNRLAKSKLDLIGTLGGGNIGADIALNVFCDGVIAAGLMLATLPAL